MYVCMYVCMYICLQDDIHGAAEQVKLAYPHVLLEASGVTAVYRISSLLCTLYVNIPFPLPPLPSHRTHLYVHVYVCMYVCMFI